MSLATNTPQAVADIGKARKLLNLFENNNNSHEANSARRKAFEILGRYGLTPADLQEAPRVYAPSKAYKPNLSTWDRWAKQTKWKAEDPRNYATLPETEEDE